MVKFLDLQAITMRHGDEIKAAIDRVVESGWFLQGNENKRFEMDYAKYIGTEFCVTVANGLDALLQFLPLQTIILYLCLWSQRGIIWR